MVNEIGEMDLVVEFIRFVNTNAGAIQAVATVLLVAVTLWYVVLTRETAESARVSAAASKDALLAESMPFVYPSFSKAGGGPRGSAAEVGVKNTGQHSALNVQLLLNDDVLHTFAVIHPGESKSREWEGCETARRIRDTQMESHVLTTRYSNPYGTRYEVQVERGEVRGPWREEEISTFRIDENQNRVEELTY